MTYYVATYILTIFFSLQFVIIAMYTDTDIWQCCSNQQLQFAVDASHKVHVNKLAYIITRYVAKCFSS